MQKESDIRCQHKIAEMVALMEKHKVTRFFVLHCMTPVPGVSKHCANLECQELGSLAL